MNWVRHGDLDVSLARYTKKMSKSTSSNKTHFVLSILGAVIFFSQRQRNGQEKRRERNENHMHNDVVHGFSLLAGSFLKEKNSL